ncbi:MAG: hypothetical protein NC452_06050 [Eubacterium sp.]|nr:hypothetical protein [Eubacterium sp.]
MLSIKTYSKILCANEKTRNTMIDKMTEENAKYLLKMVLKAVMPSDETRKLNMERFGITENQ